MSGGAKGIGLGIDFAIGNQYKRKGGKSYIDPAVLSSVVSVISTYGKTNEDADRSILKDKTGKGNDFKLLNFGFAGNSGYGLYHTNFSDWNKPSVSDFIKYLTNNSFHVINSDSSATKRVIYQNTSSSTPDIKGFKIKVEIIKGGGYYRYFDNTGRLRFFPIQESGIYELPTSYNSAMSGEDFIGFTINTNSEYKLEQLPDLEGWLYTDGVDDMIVSEKTVDEMIGDSKECTVISIINYISDIAASTNIFGRRYIRNSFIGNGIGGKYYICGYTSKNIDERGNVTVINDILGDKNDFSANYVAAAGVADYFSVTGYLDTNNVPQGCAKIAYAGGFLANKALTTDEINQIIAYFNLDRPGQIIKPQLYCNIKKQGITNDNHAEFNDQLIDFVNGYNIQLNNIGWKGESGINDGALYLDGISDFGKATGLPILKDYTVVADRKLYNGKHTGAVVSKAYAINNGSFYLESAVSVASFGALNELTIRESRFMSYQSKYIYNGNPIQVGTGVDSDSMWLGTLRDGDPRFSKFALSSLMLFSYTLSEFLLERQLKKYNAGTLYPGMVEFRPIVKSNIESYTISFYLIDNHGNQLSLLENGKYYDFSDKNRLSLVKGVIKLDNEYIDSISSVKANGIKVDINDGSFYFPVTKSPQKIDITIDRKEVLSNIKNSTWISNEQLIKNK